MTKQQPLVSIISSVWNVEPYIRTMVNSVLAQTYEPFECIIVNDASTDATATILDEYARKDDRIRIIHNTNNLNQSANLNRLIDEATGDYIAVVDGDDIFHPDKIRQQVVFMEENSDIGMCGTTAYHIDENDDLIEARSQLTTPEETYFQSRLMPAFYHPSVMYRSSVIRATEHRYNTERVSGNDYEFWFALLDETKATNIQNPLLYYRKHAESISISQMDTQARTKARFVTNTFFILSGIANDDTEDVMYRWFCNDEVPQHYSNINDVIGLLKQSLTWYNARDARGARMAGWLVGKWVVVYILRNKSLTFRLSSLIRFALAGGWRFITPAFMHVIKLILWKRRMGKRFSLTTADKQ